MVTLDIEDNSIKLMVVKGRQVEIAASLPLEAGLVHDGIIVNPVTVGQRISELMAANGISEKRVAVGISGIHSIYRVVNVPKLSKNLLEEAVQREMERAMPVPLNELYTSWQAISLSEIETAICLVGMPRNAIDSVLDTLHQAGLQPEIMDVRPLALARVVDERDALIVNAQSVGFDIVAVINGIPELVSSLPYPDDTASPDEKIAEVKEEIDRTIAFYNSNHKGSEITNRMAAFVSGELGELLSETLEYRVKPLPQLLSYTDSINTGEYAANIGLALRQAGVDISPARVNLNITPEVYKPKPFPIIQFASWALIVLGVIVVLLFGMATLRSYSQTLNLATQITNIQKQVDTKKTTQTAIKQLQKQIDDAQKAGAVFTDALDKAKAQRAKVNNSLSKVTSLLPGIIDVESINYDTKGSVTVTGIAPDDTIVIDYVRSLTDSGQFSSVMISNMAETEINTWQFTLTMK
jgi:Tfp pilus assembly protein PilN